MKQQVLCEDWMMSMCYNCNNYLISPDRKRALAPKLPRLNWTMIYPSGIGKRRPKTGEMKDTTCCIHTNETQKSDKDR